MHPPLLTPQHSPIFAPGVFSAALAFSPDFLFAKFMVPAPASLARRSLARISARPRATFRLSPRCVQRSLKPGPLSACLGGCFLCSCFACSISTPALQLFLDLPLPVIYSLTVRRTSSLRLLVRSKALAAASRSGFGGWSPFGRRISLWSPCHSISDPRSSTATFSKISSRPLLTCASSVWPLALRHSPPALSRSACKAVLPRIPPAASRAAGINFVGVARPLTKLRPVAFWSPPPPSVTYASRFEAGIVPPLVPGRCARLLQYHPLSPPPRPSTTSPPSPTSRPRSHLPQRRPSLRPSTGPRFGKTARSRTAPLVPDRSQGPPSPSSSRLLPCPRPSAWTTKRAWSTWNGSRTASQASWTPRLALSGRPTRASPPWNPAPFHSPRGSTRRPLAPPWPGLETAALLRPSRVRTLALRRLPGPTVPRLATPSCLPARWLQHGASTSHPLGPTRASSSPDRPPPRSSPASSRPSPSEPSAGARSVRPRPAPRDPP
jgi:hypothetical protein